jgi:hypothetical protein
MIDMDGWVAAGAGLLAAAAGIWRTQLRQRTRVQMERERSARSIARSAELVRIVQLTQGAVRVVEQDRDGRRLVEIGRAEGEAA